MDENEFDLDGKVYIALPDDVNSVCEGCAFYGLPCGRLTPECTPKRRMDGRSVIFVEKHP